MFSLDGFVQFSPRGACCISTPIGPTWHRRCYKSDSSRPAGACKLDCANDDGCNGYVEGTNGVNCLYMTNSDTCPSGYTLYGQNAEFSAGLGDLDNDGCAFSNPWSGCFIKPGGKLMSQ